jgi:hypothetical protein
MINPFLDPGTMLASLAKRAGLGMFWQCHRLATSLASDDALRARADATDQVGPKADEFSPAGRAKLRHRTRPLGINAPVRLVEF